MRSAPAEQRRAIYDRARQALLGQLRSMQPPVPDESINRESSALDEAIARVEADLVAPQTPGPATSSTSPPATAPSREPEPPPATAPDLAPVLQADKPRSTSASTKPAPIPQRPAPTRPAADALSRLVAERGPPAPTIRATRAEDDDEDGGAQGRPGSPMPSAPRLEIPSFAAAMAAAGEQAAAEEPAAMTAAETLAEPLPAREEAVRPPAPRPIPSERFNPRILILTVVGLLVVAIIGYVAWRLRDKPESLARAQAALIAAQQAEQQNAEKISKRADGSGPDVATTAPDAGTAPAGQAGPSAPQAATPGGPPAPAAPPAGTADNPASASQQGAAPAANGAGAVPATAAPGAGSGAAIPVAQRAAFLVDAPEEASKVKTFVGTVVWTTENASPGANQPIARTVHADVDIPDAALKLTMVFQKNFETQFPASHTLELHFALGNGSAIGAIKQINVPQMRKDDSPTGDALIGVPVTITDNYFLVGLSRGDPVAHNLDLIKTRNWFDIPMMLASGKVAKITFEKGPTGQQAIDDVLQSWQ